MADAFEEACVHGQDLKSGSEEVADIFLGQPVRAFSGRFLVTKTFQKKIAAFSEQAADILDISIPFFGLENMEDPSVEDNIKRAFQLCRKNIVFHETDGQTFLL